MPLFWRAGKCKGKTFFRRRNEWNIGYLKEAIACGTTQNRVLRELQGMQWLKTGFYRNCKVCNGPKPGFTGIARHAKAQNRVLRELQGLQWLKTGFYENCKVCNGPKPGFRRIVRSAMAQNRVLRELQGLQWPKTGFYENCKGCNGSKTGLGTCCVFSF